jgi:transcriptional regulator with XRE-family HTH domain
MARIDPISRAVGKRVRVLRDAADLTQEDLGRRSKLSPKFISAIENGHTNPSIGVVARISAAMELPLSAFFSVEPPGELVDDVAEVAALVGAQPPQARKRALRVLRALFDD